MPYINQYTALCQYLNALDLVMIVIATAYSVEYFNEHGGEAMYISLISF